MGSVCKQKTAVWFWQESSFVSELLSKLFKGLQSSNPEGHVSVREEGPWPLRTVARLFLFWFMRHIRPAGALARLEMSEP